MLLGLHLISSTFSSEFWSTGYHLWFYHDFLLIWFSWQLWEVWGIGRRGLLVCCFLHFGGPLMGSWGCSHAAAYPAWQLSLCCIPSRQGNYAEAWAHMWLAIPGFPQQLGWGMVSLADRLITYANGITNEAVACLSPTVFWVNFLSTSTPCYEIDHRKSDMKIVSWIYEYIVWASKEHRTMCYWDASKNPPPWSLL